MFADPETDPDQPSVLSFSRPIEPGFEDSAYPNVPQSNFSKITGSPIAYWVSDKVIDIFSNPMLETVATTRQGLITADNNRFLRLWHEVNSSGHR